jgi:hypothetical protein
VNSIRAPTKAFVEADMRAGVIAGTAAIGLAFVLSAAAVAQQSAADEHFARARAAAGRDFTDIFDTTCGYIRPEAYITPERPARFWFDSYAKSSQRFRDLASRAGADVVLSNHTKYDLSTAKLALVQKRARGGAHPYVIGKENVQRFFTIAAECGQAGVATKN